MKKLDAVIFDLDGVIANTSYFHFKAWRKLAGEIGIGLPGEFNDRLGGISRMESLEMILESGEKTYTDMEKNILASRKNKYYLDYIDGMTDQNLLPGVLQCFNFLKEHGIKIVLASASNNANLVLKLLGIKSYFNYIADPKEIKKGKPDPEIFMRAAAGAGARAYNCIGVEDSIAGIMAINGCNMFSVGIGKVELLYMADICIGDLSRFDYEKICAAGGFA